MGLPYRIVTSGVAARCACNTELSQVVRPLGGPAIQKCHKWCGHWVGLPYRSVTSGAATRWAYRIEVSQVVWTLGGLAI